MKIEESLNVTFDETPPHSKTSPLVDDDLDEEEAIKVTEKKNLENDIEDETLEIDEVVNIKESRNHPLENNVNEALTDESWIIAMQEELNQFITNDVWELVPQPKNMIIIGTKWVFRNKLDENGVVSRTKARLESIRILLAYAYALDFKIFQMDVKSAFLNGFINKEVYVAQPPGFIDFEKSDHVYKLKKALYGLKQTPTAWRDEFAKIMHDEFEMSMMGELNFFIELQIKQMEDSIFFNQSKYIKERLKKFSLEDSKLMKNPMSSDTKLTKDKECESVDSTKYRGMIGSLLYLTASWPDIMFSICLCALFQEAPKTSHLEAVKLIFRYIKGTTHLGLWYPKGTGIETVVYADSDHTGAIYDRKALAQLEFNYDSEGHFVVYFVIQNKSFSFTLEEFGHILRIPFKGHCSYSNKWSLDYLEISTPTKGHYQTTPPSPSVIKTLIQTPRQGQITRVCNKKTITVDENKVLNREILNHLSSWVKIIRENVFCLGGHHDHVRACLCHMLYCIETSTKYNLAFFILKRIKSIRNTPKANLPYGMLLTRLFTHVMSNFPELSNDRYILYDRVMHPLAPHYERKTRSNHGTKRCRSSNPSSSSNVLDHPSSSHHIDENDDGNDEESFHFNTPSPS
ncbi:retrovirus-related pol polyprotein from transposon TNT 1-94 [Tanacetum coccineum]